MSHKQVQTLFKRVTSEITASLSDQVTKLVEQEVRDHSSKNKMWEIQNKIDEKKMQLKDIQKEINTLEQQKESLDPEIIINNEEEYNTYLKIPGVYSTRGYYSDYGKIKESLVTAAKSVLSSKAYQNYKTWLDIRNQYDYAMSLASWIKEKRNIIMKLQSYDWHSLGIDIPASFMQFKDIDISNGIISIKALPGKAK